MPRGIPRLSILEQYTIYICNLRINIEMSPGILICCCNVGSGVASNAYYMTSCATPVIHVWCFYVYYMCRNTGVLHM